MNPPVLQRRPARLPRLGHLHRAWGWVLVLLAFVAMQILMVTVALELKPKTESLAGLLGRVSQTLSQHERASEHTIEAPFDFEVDRTREDQITGIREQAAREVAAHWNLVQAPGGAAAAYLAAVGRWVRASHPLTRTAWIPGCAATLQAGAACRLLALAGTPVMQPHVAATLLGVPDALPSALPAAAWPARLLAAENPEELLLATGELAEGMRQVPFVAPEDVPTLRRDRAELGYVTVGYGPTQTDRPRVLQEEPLGLGRGVSCPTRVLQRAVDADEATARWQAEVACSFLQPNLQRDDATTERLRLEAANTAERAARERNLRRYVVNQVILRSGDVPGPELVPDLETLMGKLEEVSHGDEESGWLWLLRMAWCLAGAGLALLATWLLEGRQMPDQRDFIAVLVLGMAQGLLAALVVGMVGVASARGLVLAAPLNAVLLPLFGPHVLLARWARPTLSWTLATLMVFPLWLCFPESPALPMLALLMPSVALGLSLLLPAPYLWIVLTVLVQALLISAATILPDPAGGAVPWAQWLPGLAVASAISLVSNGLMIPSLDALFARKLGYRNDSLMNELNSMDHPLLQRLQREAQGTFEHSLRVAHLTEAACLAVGADSRLARVGCLYHDIGKVLHPHQYNENLGDLENPHDQSDPRESARYVLGHVLWGVELAREAGLPEDIIDFIREHHGSMTLDYFLKRARLQGDDDVDEAAFRYLGPRPQSRETAICMLADGADAFARTGGPHTRKVLEERVQTHYRRCDDQGQFVDCGLHPRDIQVVIRTIVDRLEASQMGRRPIPPVKAAQSEERAAGPGPAEVMVPSAPTPPEA